MPDPTQFPDQLANRLQPVRDHPMGANLSATFGYGNRDRLGMDIQTYKAYFRHWRPTPFVCGSAPLNLPLRSVTRACYESVVGRSIMTRGSKRQLQAELNVPRRAGGAQRPEIRIARRHIERAEI